jgi:ketol-acid reductoisomerase
MTRSEYLKDRRLMRQTITAKKIAIIGYGNQGRAQAKNLRDNGVAVTVGARKGGSSWRRATEDAFEVLPISEVVEKNDIMSVLLPDEVQAEVFESEIQPGLSAQQLLVFAHGFNLYHELIQPPQNVDVVLIAPLGPGAILRENFPKGGAIPALFAVIQNRSKNAELLASAYCWGIGVSRVGVFDTTLKEETITDLFAEQAVLCGGIIELAKAAFETLVEAGYDETTAYLTCVHEVQYTAKLLSEQGAAPMLKLISPTAAYGAATRGEKIIPSARTKAAMKKILSQIEDGSFAEELSKEAAGGWKVLKKKTDALGRSPISKAQRTVAKGIDRPGTTQK